MPVKLIDAHSFEEADVQLGGQPRHRSAPLEVEYSADGRYLAVALGAWRNQVYPTLVLVWDLRHPEVPIKRYTTPISMGAADVSLSPDGHVVYIVTENDEGSALYAYSAGKRRPIPIPDGSGATFSPDGSLFAATDDETQSVVVADALTGKEQFRFTGSGRRFTRVKFSNDGSMLAGIR